MTHIDRHTRRQLKADEIENPFPRFIEEMPAVLSSGQLAAMLDLGGGSSVNVKAERGEIPFHRAGRVYVYLSEELIADATIDPEDWGLVPGELRINPYWEKAESLLESGRRWRAEHEGRKEQRRQEEQWRRERSLQPYWRDWPEARKFAHAAALGRTPEELYAEKAPQIALNEQT